ncbi:MAG TPA: DUF1583 domain-containing protein, partial [Chthoniobacteraceae bacterium]|nr:DUF1583 domain-containing protein [Chthoniobacteraceae bacterium]
SARYPELVAVIAAIERPALRPHALPIAERFVENQQDNYQNMDWERRVRWLRAKTRWLADAKTAALPMYAPPAPLTQWAPVSHPTAESRGRGLPPATWKYEQGKVEFFTGQGGDSLYYQSPLTGNFEVRCRRSTIGWKEIRLLFAGIAFDIHHEGRAAWRAPLARPQSQIPFSTLLENWGEAVDYRIVVQDGQYTVFFNDRQVHSERLAADADPWLAIQTAHGHFNGWVENLQILGSPTIPAEIKLSTANNLFAWRGDYYGDSVDTEDALWIKEKDEIVGRLHEPAPSSQRESVLYYHRPLLEDGELEYEFYYEPGKTEIHPALDRVAFMLLPEGLKLHYLTDAAYDRSGLDPENLTELPAARKFSLKARDWNKLRLKLVGDIVTLNVNGEEVAEHKLEPTNQRLFGLFRYSDSTSARVRNVVYRGNWPTTLPSINDQQLARPSR